MERNELIWEQEAFMCHPELMNSPYLKLKQEEVLGLAYFKHERDHVVKKKFSFLASFDGRHRSGKSITAATIASIIDPTFLQYFENRIVQDHQSFMDEISKLAKSGIEGGVVIVDEAGISMASTDWYERWMKVLTQTVQMFGYLYPVIFFVAPVKDFVDSRLRKMFHAYYKIERYNLNETTVTAYNLKYNTVRNKTYYKKPVIRLAGQEIVLRRIRLGKPPDFIIDRYTALERNRKDKMLDKFMQDMRRAEIKEVRQEVNLDAVVDRVCLDYKVYESKRSGPNNILLDENRIEFTCRITNRQAKFVKSEAERKLREKAKEITDAIEGKGFDGRK